MQLARQLCQAARALPHLHSLALVASPAAASTRGGTAPTAIHDTFGPLLRTLRHLHVDAQRCEGWSPLADLMEHFRAQPPAVSAPLPLPPPPPLWPPAAPLAEAREEVGVRRGAGAPALQTLSLASLRHAVRGGELVRAARALPELRVLEVAACEVVGWSQAEAALAKERPALALVRHLGVAGEVASGLGVGGGVGEEEDEQDEDAGAAPSGRGAGRLFSSCLG